MRVSTLTRFRRPTGPVWLHSIQSRHVAKHHPQLCRSFNSSVSSDEKDGSVFMPPKKIEELFNSTSGNKFFSLNSPVSGARFEQELPKGSNSFQLYSVATPNGQKVGIALEELGVAYDAHIVNIMEGAQFSSGFVALNPNSKIPTAIDYDGPGGKSVRLFESGSIILYLADKYKGLMPVDSCERIEAMNWIFWQMSGQGPMCGNFGHFMVYAPDNAHQARNYGIARYGMEVLRLCSTMDNHLKNRKYFVGNEYSMADIMIFPWFQQLRTGYKHKLSGVSAASLLSIEEKFPNAVAWADRVAAREAVQRGMEVCKPPPKKAK